MRKEMIKGIKRLGIKIEKYDREYRPHATVAYGNTKKSFNGIWNYLKTLESPKFDLKFDNIAILKKRKYWEIYKVYKIK